MLVQVSEEITSTDLKKMKMLLTGEGGAGLRVLEQIKDGCDLITHLKHEDKLDKHNLIHLQALIWKTGNKSLHKTIVNYAKTSREQPLHFFPVKDTLDDGKEKVEFHIGGGVIKGTDLENLRSLVACYICVPLEEVALNGVKPFRSIVITFLIPKRAAECLLDLSIYQKRSLQDLNIDQIQVGKKSVSLKGEKFDEIPVLTENDEIKKILTAKLKLEDSLERKQAKLLEKERELTNLRTQYKREEETLKKTQDLLKEQHVAEKALSEGIPAKLSDHTDYEVLLKEIKQQHPGAIERVKRLLELKSKIIRKTETILWKAYSDALHKYVEYLLHTYEIQKKPSSLSHIDEITEITVEKERDEKEIDVYDKAIDQLSKTLDLTQKEALKMDTDFSISEEELLDNEPHKFLHILLKYRCPQVTDKEKKRKKR